MSEYRSPTADELKAQESGLIDPNSPPKGGDVNLPPNAGQLVFNSYQAFSAAYNSGSSRTWRVLFDEALSNGGETNAEAMWNDAVIFGAVRERQYPTVQLECSLEAQDETDPAQAQAIDGLTRIMDEIPFLQDLKRCLLMDMWYGKSAVQCLYSWKMGPGGRRQMTMDDWWPLHGDKLVRRWGGQWGVLVNGEYRGPKESTDYYTAHFLEKGERSSFCISQFEREDASFTYPQFGGRINGVGLRSRLYYVWMMKVALQGIALDYAQLTATGFTVYFFEAGNPKNLAEVKQAAEQQIGQNVILMPRLRDQGQAGPGVMRVEPGTAGTSLLTSLFTDYFDGVIRRTILGQSLTTEVGTSELGGDAAGGMAEALSRITKYDAHRLEWVLYRDLIQVLCRYNYPNVPCPRLRFSVEKPDAAGILNAASQLFQMGAQIDQNFLLEVVGIPRPQPGRPVLSMLAPQQPSAVTGVPQGVPISQPAGPAGPAGPDQQGQGQQQGGDPSQNGGPSDEASQAQAASQLYGQLGGSNGVLSRRSRQAVESDIRRLLREHRRFKRFAPRRSA